MRQNKKHPGIWETFALQSTLNVTKDRENKVELTKVKNSNGLAKFMPASLSLINFLEKINKVKILEISIDFIIDVFDVAWVINLKHALY